MGSRRIATFLMLILAPFLLGAGTYSIDEVSVPLRMDGHLEDWPSARMFLIDREDQVVIGKGLWRKAEDSSARVFLAYDPDFLYLAALVKKKGKVANDNPLPSLWNGDSLEFFLGVAPQERRNGRLSKGDFHIVLSPGTDAKDPRAYCFNRDREITGARIGARITRQGYLLEAGLPLHFFSGLRVGDSRTTAFNLALNEAGEGSRRIHRMNFAGPTAGWRVPSVWPNLEWTGTTVMEIPGDPPPSSHAGAIEDGVRGATFLGVRDLLGRVAGADGKPLAGVHLTTWPRSVEAVTDAEGRFTLSRARVYDRTLVGASLEGYGTAWAPRTSLGKDAIRMHPLPGYLGDGIQTSFGWRLEWPSAPGDDWPGLGKEGLAKGGILLLAGGDSRAQGLPDPGSVLKKFLRACGERGAEPWIQVPSGDPARAAEWVRFTKQDHAVGVRYWVVGTGADDPQDLPGLVNRFRTTALALKREAPSAFVLGPGMGMDSLRSAMESLVPFIQFNEDALDLVSVHRPGFEERTPCTRRKVEDSLRAEPGILRGLQDRISESLERQVPLVVVGEGPCAEGPLDRLPPSHPGRMAGPLWMAERGGIAFREGIGAFLFDRTAFGRVADPGLGDKVLGLLRGLKGRPVPVQTGLSDLSVFASKDPGTGEVALLLLNKGDRYRRVRIRLDGRPADISVESGVARELEHEVHSHSVALLRIQAGQREAEALVIDRRSLEAGRDVQTRKMMTW